MSFVKYIIQFIAYLILQVFVFQHLDFMYAPAPHIAILFVVFTPLRVAKSIYYVSCFTFGILLDAAIQPLGAHAMSAVFIAGLRSLWLEAIKPQVSTEELEILDLDTQSIAWQLTYSVPLIVMYEFLYYILVDFGFSGATFIKVLSGSSYTIFISIIFIILFYRKTAQ